MKNYLLKTLLLSFFLLCNILTSAQNNDPIPDNVPIEGDETPIDGGLLWLGVAGVAFGLYYYSTQRKKQVN